MNYDPIKDRFGELAAKAPAAQRALYAGLQAVFLRNWYVRRAIRELHASWPKDKPLRVLDAGTGFGQHSYFIAKTFPQAEILAVDVKQDYLDQARRFFDQTPYKDRIRFEWADLTQFERDEQFNFILSVDVMEHIEEDVAVFQNFAKVLAPGGHVVINTPSDQGGSDVDDESDESFIGEHVRDGYAPAELGSKLQSAGLTPVRHHYSYGSAGSAAWRMLVKWPMKALSKTFAASVLLPVYYLPVFPAGMALNWLDVRQENERGTGLLMVARKA